MSLYFERSLRQKSLQRILIHFSCQPFTPLHLIPRQTPALQPHRSLCGLEPRYQYTNTFQNVPIASPFSPHYPLYHYYSKSSSDHNALQPALSVSHKPGTVAVLLLNPAIQILESTLPVPFHPQHQPTPPLNHKHPRQPLCNCQPLSSKQQQFDRQHSLPAGCAAAYRHLKYLLGRRA